MHDTHAYTQRLVDLNEQNQTESAKLFHIYISTSIHRYTQTTIMQYSGSFNWSHANKISFGKKFDWSRSGNINYKLYKQLLTEFMNGQNWWFFFIIPIFPEMGNRNDWSMRKFTGFRWFWQVNKNDERLRFVLSIDPFSIRTQLNGKW